MTGELVNRQTGEMETLSVEDIVARVNFIRTVTESVMKGPTQENPEGIHYGIIPGCKKPTLLKPGAEVLSMTFRLRPIIKEQGEDVKIIDLANGHREYVVYCHVFNMAGIELSTGVGSCSTMESKYRYRGGEKKAALDENNEPRPIPKEYWNLRKAGKLKEAQDLIGGSGFSAGKINGSWVICEIGEKMENPDIADVYNTCLKIAKKRSYIDGVLSATGASEHFTQDIEDLGADPEASAKPKTETHKPQDEAKKTDENIIPLMTGIVTAIEPHKYKTGAVKTDYIVDDGEGVVIISVWNTPDPKIAVGSSVRAINIKVTEFKGLPQHTAESIKINEPEIPFGK